MAVETNDLIRPVWLYNYKLGHNAERLPLANGGESAEMVFMQKGLTNKLAYSYIIQK
ncbi:hypothetical protein S1OALGB6SA_49 [Olavius algarvensis spirochete endosymbiont]|nr:hypothetical protein S1OALGB6SA_49 [Olavius algarvensis spirochete endosymbiont]